MTTVVAIAHHGHVYFGADTAFTTDCQMTDPEGKLMTLPGLIALGTANDKRAATVLRYAFTPPPFPEGGDEQAYMRFTFPEAVRSLLARHIHVGVKYDAEYSALLALIGWRGQLWQMHANYAMTQNTDGFDAIGSGSQFALGVLHALPDLPPRERLERALLAASHFDGGTRAPFDYLTTQPMGGEHYGSEGTRTPDARETPA